MTVAFGTPAAEHVTITAGVPLSMTGLMSSGNRVTCTSGLHLRNQPRARPGTWCLHVNLLHLEFNGNRRRENERLQHADRRLGPQGMEALHEAFPDSRDGREIVGLYCTMTQIASFQLVGLV